MSAPPTVCPCRAERIEDLYRALPARRAWLVLLLAHDVRHHGPATVGELVERHAIGPSSAYDVARAIRAAETHGWLRIVEHEHERLVGLPLLFEEQAAVPVTAPLHVCRPEAAAA